MIRNRTIRDMIAGYAFLAPAMLFFILFIGEPVVIAIYLSFTKYNVITPATWIGGANFKHFFNDPRVLTMYGKTP